MDTAAFAKVGKEQGPEQARPSPEVPLYFPQERLDGSILMKNLNSLPTARSFFYGKDRALGKLLETSRLERALVPVQVEESFV